MFNSMLFDSGGRYCPSQEDDEDEIYSFYGESQYDEESCEEDTESEWD